MDEMKSGKLSACSPDCRASYRDEVSGKRDSATEGGR